MRRGCRKSFTIYASLGSSFLGRISTSLGPFWVIFVSICPALINYDRSSPPNGLRGAALVTFVKTRCGSGDYPHRHPSSPCTDLRPPHPEPCLVPRLNRPLLSLFFKPARPKSLLLSPPAGLIFYGAPSEFTAPALVATGENRRGGSARVRGHSADVPP